jgi:hypothetical protein
MGKNIISQSQMMAMKNNISGELETAKVTMIVERDEPKYKGLDFTILFQIVSRVMVKEMTPISSRLLLFCLTIVDYGNKIPMGINQMAEELLYSKRQCQRGMDELINFKVIIKQQHPIDKRMVEYYLNPLQSWKGKVIERTKRIAETPINQLDLFATLPGEHDVRKQYTLMGDKYINETKSKKSKLEPSRDFE